MARPFETTLTNGGSRPPTPPPSESSRSTPSSQIVPLPFSPSLSPHPSSMTSDDNEDEKDDWAAEVGVAVLLKDQRERAEETERGGRRDNDVHKSTKLLSPSTSFPPIMSRSGSLPFDLSLETKDLDLEGAGRRWLALRQLSSSPQPLSSLSPEDDPPRRCWTHERLLPTHHTHRRSSFPSRPQPFDLLSWLPSFLARPETSSPFGASTSIIPRSPHHASHSPPPSTRSLGTKLLLTAWHVFYPLLSLLILIALSLPLLGFLNFYLGRVVLQGTLGLPFTHAAHRWLFWMMLGGAVGCYGLGGYRMVLDVGGERRVGGIWGWWLSRREAGGNRERGRGRLN